MILLLVYLLLIVVFGVIYCLIANGSAGHAYICQRDLKIDNQIGIFQKQRNFRIPDSIIYTLIEHKEYKKQVVHFKMPNDSFHFNFSGKVGRRWAVYYGAKFEAQGITHYSIESITKYRLNPFMPSSYKVNIRFYKYIGPESEFKGSRFYGWRRDFCDYIVKDSCFLLFENNPDEFLPRNPLKHDYFPMGWEVQEIIAESYNFLDESLYDLKRIVEGYYSYPLIDFLYFSVVTITTLGYGDILPNSSVVRICVIIETLLGIVIIGAFISSLFLLKKK